MATEVSGFLSVANTMAQRFIEPILQDGVFLNDPLPAILKRDCLKKYDGGLGWQLNFEYDVLPVQDLPRGGATFDLSSSNKQLSTGCNFDIRSKVVIIQLDYGLLSAELWPGSPNVKTDYIEERLQNAALSMSGKIANDIYRDGQNVGGEDRTLAMNGLDEYLSDGVTNGFRAKTFTSYGTVTRNANNIGNALNSPMTTGAGQGVAASIGGPLSYGILEDTYNSVVVGNVMPNLIMTTNKGASIMKKLIAPQGRFEIGEDPDFGFKRFMFNGTPVYQSQYCPGSRTATAADTLLGYATVSAGETIWFLNTDYLMFYVSSVPTKSFSLLDFVPSQNSQTLTAPYLADLNLVGKPGANRFQRYIYAVTN